MKKYLLIALASMLLSGLNAFSCNKDMQKLADKVSVRCNPDPIALKGGAVQTDLSINFPPKYFNKKAVVVATPVFVYDGGEIEGAPLKYQGEKVVNNYRVVRYLGGIVNEHIVLPYKEGMAQGKLEIRAKYSTNNGKKWIDLPVKVVASGCNLTENLAGNGGCYEYKSDNYQEVITRRTQGQIMYMINSAEVRNSELKGESITEFQKSLTEADGNERDKIKNIDIIAYASPDGGEKLNDKLSMNRSQSASDKFKKVVSKKAGVDNVSTNVMSIGQDWEGFKESVEKSNIQDKDLILRVLSMYSDPEVREKEIRNIASVYEEVANEVLPLLRRARFIANIEHTNYSDEELEALIKEDIDVLDEEALLKAATLCDDNADKKVLYEKAVSKFKSSRAQFNLACLALDNQENAEAEEAVRKCDAGDPEVANLAGVCAMRKGNADDAKEFFKKAGTECAKKNLGTYDILEGNYTAAIINCGNESCDAALARLLDGDTDAAMKCIEKDDSAKANYIKAICLCKAGDIDNARAALKKACEADAELAKRAETDIELAALRQ